MKKLTTMRKALADAVVLGDALPGASWSAWRTILIAAMGEELLPEEREVFAKLTGGREREPGEPVEMLSLIEAAGSASTNSL